MSQAIVYGLIFAIAGVGVYLFLCNRDNKRKTKQLNVAKEKYDQLALDVKKLKDAYRNPQLSGDQRDQVRALHEKARSELKSQAVTMQSLNQEL